MSSGVFVIGEFRGVHGNEKFPQIYVRTGAPSEKNPDGFAERIDFAPFDQYSGKRVLPEGIAVGDWVQVDVIPTPKSGVGRESGKAYEMVTWRAREVVVVPVAA